MCNYIPLMLLMVSLSQGQQPERPSWLKERPQDPDYYVGIGQVMINNRSATVYQKEANDLAFREIANQIRTEIAATAKHTVVEDEKSFSSVFEQSVVTSTIADLEGLELVDTYKTTNEYHVLWRLSKAAYERTVTKYEAQAISFFMQENSLMISDVVPRLSVLIKGLESVTRAMNKEIVAKINGDEFVLNSEIPQRIEDAVSRLLTKGGNTEQVARVGESLDAPLKFRALYTFMGVDHPVRGLTVKYSFEKGRGSFVSDEATTNSNGECDVLVSKILSEDPSQTIRAQIDLKKLKSSGAAVPGLDDYLDGLTSTRAVYYRVSVSGLARERIALKVFAEEGIPETDIGYLNEIFISKTKQLTEFSLMERGMMDEILQEQGFNAAECSSEECQIEVGRMLAVRKMIYVILWRFSGEYRGTIKLINIETGENEHVESITYAGSVTQLADEGVANWVKTFYSSLNLGRMTLTSSLPNIQVFSSSEFWGELPVWDKKLEPGTYELVFVRPGYEAKKTRYNITLGQTIQDKITLRPKSRRKAFVKSIVFPGLGQFYSSDRNNPGRKVWGSIFAATGIASFIGTTSTWYGFLQAQNAYNEAYKNYMKQEALEDISASRSTVEQKNKDMIDHQVIAAGISTATALLWLTNALESAINFPDYGKESTSRDNPFGVSFINANGQTYPAFTYKISF